MNLPFSTSPKTASRAYFFALEICEGALQSSIWTVENEKIQVISSGSYERFHNNSDFIAAADKSLTQSASSLNIDPSSIKKVILGLPSSWLSTDKILPERSRQLKDFCQQLDLKPIGFVVTAESVVRYLHSTEGVPPTAIIVGISDHDLEITVVRLGKIIGIHTVKRGSQIADDVKEGLSRFLPADLFPSRILLYDHGVELETIRQQLLSFPWQASQHRLPFLHFPKIDILPSGTSVKAISITAGPEAIQNQPTLHENSNQETITSEPASDFDDLGFIENVDLALDSTPVKKPPTKITQEIKPRHKISFPVLPSLPAIPSFRLTLVVLIILIIIASPFAYWYFFVSAKIILTFVPQTVSTRFTDTLPLSSVTTEAETDVSLPTTGSVQVGDKATGTVTIVNGTNVIKTFPSQTELVSDSGLKFITTQSVTVASASGTADPNSYQPGKADVGISASAIGADSNLSAGSEFKIGSFSKLDYVARNSTAFSGGSSRQVQAVSKKDLSDAKSQADLDLSTKAEVALKNSLPPASVLVLESITQKTVSETFSAKEGEEANLLSLNKKIKVEGKVYQQSSLDQLVEARLSPLYPSGSKLLSSPKSEVSFTKNQANISANVELAPDIDTDLLAKQLIGRSVTEINNRTQNLSGLSKIDIEFKPSWGNFFKRFPYRSQNLSIFSTFTTP